MESRGEAPNININVTGTALSVAGESLPAQPVPPAPVLLEGSLWQSWGFPDGGQPLPLQTRNWRPREAPAVARGSALILSQVPVDAVEQAPALSLRHLNPFPQRLALHPAGHLGPPAL